MDAKVQMTREAGEIIRDQLELHLRVLEEYTKKSEDQTTMAERLRAERNTYKRQFEAVSVELNELRTQYNQLSAEVKSLEAHLSEMLTETITAHADNMKLAAQKKVLMDTTEGQRKRMLETERTISRLQAEAQTLMHIWTEAQHDRLQMTKERQVLDNNIKVAQDELSKKCKTIERLRSQINVEQRFLRKCASQYTEKANTVVVFVRELAILDAKTTEFTEKRDRMLGLEYESLRLTTEAMFERQKCSALIHEFSIQRNVHRWDVMSVVDSNHVKALRYRCLLTSKLDEAHRYLIELVEERNKLRQEVARIQENQPKATKEDIKEHIQKYEADIIAKDAKIQEMSRQVNGNQPGMHSSLTNIAKVHGEIVARRGNCARLRTQSVAALRAQGPAPWFLTEAPADKVLGGGFVSRAPTVPESVSGGQLEAEIPDTEKRAKSMLSSVSNSRKVTKPVAQLSAGSSPKKANGTLARASDNA
jgi:chromosome segregation ATPase